MKSFFKYLRQGLSRPYSLLDAELKTGRTHQIRVHLAHLGFPILGDDKYGDFALNKALAKQGLRRMFLHARRLAVRHPLSGEKVVFEAPLPVDLQQFMEAAKRHAQPFELLVFDWDGTLMDSAAAIAEALQAACADLDLSGTATVGGALRDRTGPDRCNEAYPS